MNLFERVLANSTDINLRFQTFLGKVQPPAAQSLSDFVAWVNNEALISINADSLVVVELLSGRKYQNDVQWAHDRSRLSGRSADEHRRERLGKWYEKRVRFDAECDESGQFIYGALNAGGAGSLKYGSCCIVLSRRFQDALHKAVCVPGDTLSLCITKEGAFDSGPLARFAPFSLRHLLVACEKGDEVPLTPQGSWPNLLLSSQHYFETIFIGDVDLSAIYCIRMEQAEYERKWNMAFFGTVCKPDEAERALIQDFISMSRAVSDGVIRLEIVYEP